ncbi:hypothetical protein C8R43DRAFT_1125655 [Mycena crocata]|nr:hypothetical protein C8R43DRAFT_1125655 [Mycena crocata]
MSTIVPFSSIPVQKSPVGEADDGRAQAKTSSGRMQYAEREEERREIVARLGPGIFNVMKKICFVASTTSDLSGPAPAPPTSELPNETVPLDSSPRSSSPVPRGALPPALSNSSLSSPIGTRHASRMLRFAELTPDGVHVYESALPSPRKQAMLALLPRSADDDADEPFSLTTAATGSAPTTLHFDLTGTPLAAPLHAALPTHLGLHHHTPDVDGVQHAGYTFDDVFIMSRSGVRVQCIAGMRMLVGVA